VVPEAGNAPAQAAIERVFELRDFFEWRGLGSIEHSGVRMREAYARYDAERRFAVPALKVADPKACQCGDVLKGIIKPRDCRLFGSACTPETPLGALMVSSEGSCAAYYQYGDLDRAPLARAG
jgi:hydrogenase expression/formation protein HypD